MTSIDVDRHSEAVLPPEVRPIRHLRAEVLESLGYLARSVSSDQFNHTPHANRRT